MLYSFSADFFCCSLGKLFMIENPRNSLFWLTTRWKESSCAGALYFCEHQACAHGGRRPKWTRLAANFPHVGAINGKCPGNHKQGASKRIFATALEVHYPPALCKAIVHSFILCLTEMGLQFTEEVRSCNMQEPQQQSRANHSSCRPWFRHSPPSWCILQGITTSLA